MQICIVLCISAQYKEVNYLLLPRRLCCLVPKNSKNIHNIIWDSSVVHRSHLPLSTNVIIIMCSQQQEDYQSNKQMQDEDVHTKRETLQQFIMQSILGYTIVSLLCEGREYLCIPHDFKYIDSKTKRWHKTKFSMYPSARSNLKPANSLAKFVILYHTVAGGVLILIW